MQDYEKENDGFKYILTCIDIFSKYAWVVPVKNKMGSTILKLLKQSLKVNESLGKFRLTMVVNSSINIIKNT